MPDTRPAGRGAAPLAFQKLAAEFLGTGALLAAVVGSGIMGESLAGGNTAIALLANAIATGAILVVLITVFAPLSGAHLNPVVTAAMAWQRRLSPAMALGYAGAQTLGALAGTVLAHAMFALPLLQVSDHLRTGWPQWLSEAVATAGLLLLILRVAPREPKIVPALVGLYITSAYWFTGSTSFANPAVTLARGLTQTFSGIRPGDMPAFWVAQTAGAFLAFLFHHLLGEEKKHAA